MDEGELITIAGHGRWETEDGEFVLHQQVTCFCDHANEITDELGICIQNNTLPANQPTWDYYPGQAFPNYTVIPGEYREPDGYTWKPITVTIGTNMPSKPTLLRDYLQQLGNGKVKLAICRNQKGVLAEWSIGRKANMESRGLVLDVEAEALPLSEGTQKAIHAAYEEAHRYKDDTLSTEHLLLGFLRFADSVLRCLLMESQVSVENTRAIVERSRTGGYSQSADISMTPRARRVLHLAGEEAQHLQSDHIELEHLLLGLLREDEGLAAVVLKKRGLRLEELRLQVRGLTAINV